MEKKNDSITTTLVIIGFDLLQSIVLILFVRSLVRYLRKFKSQADPFTVSTMIILGLGILCKITVSFPLRCIALAKNLDSFDEVFDDDSFLNDDSSLLFFERLSILFTSGCIDAATLCNLTRWILITLSLQALQKADSLRRSEKEEKRGSEVCGGMSKKSTKEIEE
jgi:hypothetical protein